MVLTIVLSLMAWDANTLTYAFAADGQPTDPVAGQDGDKGEPTNPEKAAPAAATDTPAADAEDVAKGGDPVDQAPGKTDPAITAQGEDDTPATDPETPTEPAAAPAQAKTYKITWIDEDGTVLEVDEDVEAGTMPTYDGAIPTKADSDDYTYEFAGWSPQITEAAFDKSYKAVYSATSKQFQPDSTLGDSAMVYITQILWKKAPSMPYTKSFEIVKGAAKTLSATGILNNAGGKNATADYNEDAYQFLNVFMLATGNVITCNDGSPDASQTIKKIKNSGNGTMTVTFNDGSTEVVSSNILSISPVYKVTYSGYLNFVHTDNVGTGSGGWGGYRKPSEDYTNTFEDQSVKTPVSHYRFLYWQREDTGDTFSDGDKLKIRVTASTPGEQFTVKAYAVWQPSVTVNYHNWNGSSLDSIEQFESIDVYSATTAPDIEGAKFLGWYDAEGNLLSTDATYEKPALAGQEVVDPVTHDVYARYSTSYKVQHLVQSLDGEGYEVRAESTVDDVLLGTGVSATANTYEGFTFDPSVEGTLTETTITESGTVLKLYYTRNSHTVTYAYEGEAPDNAPDLPAEVSYKYGATVDVEPAAAVDGYTFSGWSAKGSFVMPDEDVVITGSFTKNPAPAPAGGTTPADDPTDEPTTPTEPVTPAEPTEPAATVTPATTTPAAAAPAAAPAAAAPAAPAAAPAAPAAPAADATPTTPDTPEEAAISENDTPMAQSIEDNDSPLASGAMGSWALVNLISTILTVVVGLVLIVRMFGRKREEDEENNEESETVYKRHRLLKGIACLAAPLSIVIFMLTENMSLPMVLVDQWTILMLAVLAVQIILAVVARKNEEDTDDDQTQMAAPMTA